ncbi:hypothetical protein OPV22_001365 [Ensete ventricosum]|uniref:Transmembrane protein n=1 Tax=Ensete ventricosum TaxID=4639 RepID=A0AAV8QIF3_ENSVE|nr:hypothetical protein OPV22_001365 [Ensete ventricosum]
MDTRRWPQARRHLRASTISLTSSSRSKDPSLFDSCSILVRYSLVFLLLYGFQLAQWPLLKSDIKCRPSSPLIKISKVELIGPEGQELEFDAADDDRGLCSHLHLLSIIHTHIEVVEISTAHLKSLYCEKRSTVVLHATISIAIACGNRSCGNLKGCCGNANGALGQEFHGPKRGHHNRFHDGDSITQSKRSGPSKTRDPSKIRKSGRTSSGGLDILKQGFAMAARVAARYVVRRLSSGGKVLSEEEKAVENVYIKKMEQEKLEKLAHKGSKPGQQTPAKSETPAAAAKPGTPPGSSTASVSTDKNRNYAVLAGTVSAVCALGWYLLSKPKKSEAID